MYFIEITNTSNFDNKLIAIAENFTAVKEVLQRIEESFCLKLHLAFAKDDSFYNYNDEDGKYLVIVEKIYKWYLLF